MKKATFLNQKSNMMHQNELKSGLVDAWCYEMPTAVAFGGRRRHEKMKKVKKADFSIAKSAVVQPDTSDQIQNEQHDNSITR